MTPFSDEDLKRVKKLPKNLVITDGDYPSLRIRDIVSRLEAAERIITKSGIAWPVELDDEFKAWLKSKGAPGDE